jgi:hypothetical protein
MRQSTLSMGTAAVMRRATRSMGPSHTRQTSRSSFDILSEPAGAHPAHADLETPPSITGNAVDPFVSPFPAPPPRNSFEQQREGAGAVPWGAAATRGHVREKSDGTLDSLRPDAQTRRSVPAPSLVPLNTSGTQGSVGRSSRKLSGQFGETPPQTPTVRPTSQLRSPVQRTTSSGGLTRWSVDEDAELGSTLGSMGSRDRLSGVEEGRVSPSTTTFIQHNDGGPGGVM